MKELFFEEKPLGATLGWQLLDSSLAFSTPWMKLRQDRLLLGNTEETTYTYHMSKDSVCIVPVTVTNEIALIRQYRYPVDTWCIEIPSGGQDWDVPLPLEELALKELKEELGATCQELKKIATFFPTNSISEEKCHVYIALGVEFPSRQELEPSELIEIVLTPIQEAIRLAHAGAISDAFSALALCLCEPILQELNLII